MRVDKSKENLAEIVAMLQVSGLSPRGLSLAGGKSEDTVKKIIPRGGSAYESTMAELRAGMRKLGFENWMPEGADELRLAASLRAAARAIGPITDANASEAAALQKEIYDNLVAQRDLLGDQIEVAANNFARGRGRRRDR